MTDPRRALPSVDRLLREDAVRALLADIPRAHVVQAIRATLTAVRAGRQPVPDDWGAAIRIAVAAQATPSLQPVINATGVVLHTNLGRAPLAPAAIAAATEAAGYASLEFDLATGSRGSRQDHCAGRLARLCGAPAAMVVNNAAGALVLSLHALAAGREVIISRGELIEIGGSFRIPDILAGSGAILREVGTTNRTHLRDYADACHEGTGAILTVHRSNFEQVGFVTSPAPAELAALAHARGIPFIHDVGSGLMQPLDDCGLEGEPLVPDAVSAGADLVIFSGDKLLGGPQAGCLAGSAAAVAACRGNPMARAMRVDKMSLAALEATLELYRDPATARREVPVLRMLTASADQLATAAARLHRRLSALPWPADGPLLRPDQSTPGGGSFPGAQLPTTAIVIDPGPIGAEELAARLRAGSPPVIGRVHAGRLLLDPRTVAAHQEDALVEALSQALDQATG